MGHLRLILCLGLLWAQANDSVAVLRFLQREVQHLCQYAGRGYVQAGAARAAQYLAKRFAALGYCVQWDTFAFEVRLVKKAKLRWGGRRMRLGIDFWPEAGSPSAVGTWIVDSLPRPGVAWVLSDSLSLAEALRLGRRHEVALLVRLQPKVNAAYAQKPLPLPVLYVRERPSGSHLSLRLQVESQTVEAYNVIARSCTGQSPTWLVGAHYDHLGAVGGTTFWGANDNASGVAMLLALADRLTAPHVWFVAFGAEEVGLLGSFYFVERHRAELKTLSGMINLDLMGFGEKGIGVVGGADQPTLWQKVDSIRQIVGWHGEILLRPNAPNSDHYPFRLAGFPALFFYLLGGPGYYHDPLDKPKTLTWQGAYGFLRWLEALLR